MRSPETGPRLLPWTRTSRPPACGGALRRISFATPTPSRWPTTVEMAHEGVPLIVIQRQLGHTNLGITSIYLQGIDNAEIIDTVHARRAPMVRVQRVTPALTGSPRRRSSRIA
jgi:hypothetical protein